MGFSSATMLIDIMKFYEQVPHRIIVQEAIATEFLLAILRVVLGIYQGVRILAIDRSIGPPARASQSMLAGCFDAVSLGKALLLRTLDRVAGLWVGVTLSVVVDDVSIQVIDLPHRLSKRMVDTVSIIASGLQDRLHLPISRPKTNILANSIAVRRSIAKGLRAKGLHFEQSDHAEHLGIDFASGRRLVRNKLRARLMFVRQRQGKWASLRRGGGNTKRLAVTGASPALLYGTRVVGANDTECHAFRREVASVADNTDGGESMLM